ncbi:MAG: hypothetical protein SYNGOMJ08_00707 [Candidatus Syntrophoarchaeum sp. GoM_oil]|nr:MAG: hypothetical protein SYNGOMJ08_00707 [Candidatus Syntrophoarchaeum sp. GoM_oil]
MFGHVKQNIGLREFLTRGLSGVRAEFGLACIAHNLKRIWKVKGQNEGIGVNPTKDGRFGHAFLKFGGMIIVPRKTKSTMRQTS